MNVTYILKIYLFEEEMIFKIKKGYDLEPYLFYYKNYYNHIFCILFCNLYIDPIFSKTVKKLSKISL